jgi:small subunit ribosomal protein S6
MKKYIHETTYIVRPDVSEEVVTNITNKLETLLRDTGATEIDVQNLGKKRLAQPIKKHRDGVYVQITYKSNSSTQVATLERSIRLTEEVIRFLTLKYEVKDKPLTEEEAVVAE